MSLQESSHGLSEGSKARSAGLNTAVLQSVYACIADGVVVMDQTGAIVAANPAAQRILGLTLDQICGRTPKDPRWGAIREDGSEFPPSEHPSMVTLRTGQAVRSHVHGVRAGTGQTRWICVSTEPVLDETGHPSGVVATLTDVTLQREQTQRLEAIVASSGLGTWDWDVTSGIVRYNERWATMLGYRLEELAPSFDTWKGLVHPDDLQAANERLAAHFDGREDSYVIEVRMMQKNGQYRWVMSAGRVARWSADRKPLRMAGVHIDIDETKRAQVTMSRSRSIAERAVRETQALRAALDEHSLLSIADRSGRILEVNTGFCKISGYAREELLGQDHRILNSGMHPRSFWVEVWKCIASGRAWRGEVCNQRKDGSLYWVDSTIVPHLDEHGKVEKYVSIRFDITARKKAEVDLMQAKAMAQAADSAKSEFLANMSHEIRTPMTAILGYADLLSAEFGDREASTEVEYVDIIRRNGEHLLTIINDILDISKIEAGKMSVEELETSPMEIVQDVLTLMGVKARGKGVHLEAVFETPMPVKMKTDPIRLRQILVNLVGNAIKFTEIGGVTLMVGCDFDRQQVRFDIVDTGIGLSREQMDRLFGAFVQADTSTARRFGGTGLGLRISKRLAEMLGGDITVRSEIGRGSTFTAMVRTGPIDGRNVRTTEELRKMVAEHQMGERGIKKDEPKVLTGVRILLAEDGPDNRRLISFHLQRAGADVETAENGRLAMERLIGAGADAFDIVITDVQMPEMDGLTMTRQLRLGGMSKPIVALTAHAMSKDLDECLEAGCTAVATKPIQREKLIETVARLVAERGEIAKLPNG
jgi:PAS domain S-box-containing protein